MTDVRIDAAAFDRLSDGAAQALLHPVCASDAWIAALVAGRPYGSLAGDRGAFGRGAGRAGLGRRRRRRSTRTRGSATVAAATGQEAEWSRAEQSAAAGGTDELRAGNLAYEERFGQVFLICATGRIVRGDPGRVAAAAGQRRSSTSAAWCAASWRDRPAAVDQDVSLRRWQAREPVDPRARRGGRPSRGGRAGRPRAQAGDGGPRGPTGVTDADGRVARPGRRPAGRHLPAALRRRGLPRRHVLPRGGDRVPGQRPRRRAPPRPAAAEPVRLLDLPRLDDRDRRARTSPPSTPPAPSTRRARRDRRQPHRRGRQRRGAGRAATRVDGRGPAGHAGAGQHPSPPLPMDHPRLRHRPHPVRVADHAVPDLGPAGRATSCTTRPRPNLAWLALTGCTTSTDHHYVFPRDGGDLLGAEIRGGAADRAALPPDTRLDEPRPSRRRAAAGRSGRGARRDPGRVRSMPSTDGTIRPRTRCCASRSPRARRSRSPAN